MRISLRRATLRRLAAVVPFLIPLVAHAQSVTGRVLEAATRRPLAHVTVTLLDSAGRPAAKAETLPDGVFYLDAPAAGTYALDFVPADGAPPLRTPARLLAAGQEVQAEYVLAPASAAPDTAPPGPAAPLSDAALLLGMWYDPQPRGWPELDLRIDRVAGDSVFGELTEMSGIVTAYPVRGSVRGSHVELRVARPGAPEARITGELDKGYIVARHLENRGWDHFLPMIRFGRQKY